MRARYKRRHNTRRIKRGYSYTVQEIAALYGLHKNTVRAWLKQGLPTIDSTKPLLVHGGDLIAWLKQQQARRKTALKPPEFYCLRCRAARLPLGMMVDCIPHSEKRLMLTALCGVCEGMICKVGSVQRLPEYERVFVTATRAPHQSLSKEKLPACLSGPDRSAGAMWPGAEWIQKSPATPIGYQQT